MTDGELESLHTWVLHWGDGPNWSDATGRTIPIAKTTAIELINELLRARHAVRLRSVDATDTPPSSSPNLPK